MNINHNHLTLFAFCLLAISLSCSQVLAGTASDPSVLLLNSGRFAVTVDYANFEGNEFSLDPSSANGKGQAVQLTDDTGYFFFPNDRGTRNADVLVKLLDGCPVNSHFWVFSAGTTNYQVTLTVTDTVTSATKVYINPAGMFFPSIFDTNAFATCDAGVSFLSGGSPEATSHASSNAVKSAASARRVSHAVSEIDWAAEACTPDATCLCLLRNRFRVEVEWAFNGHAGSGHAVTLPETDESGLFWMFSAANFELVVKMIDGRDANGYFWVFAGSMTNVEQTITITDTETGEVRVYFNPAGIPDAVADNRAFGPRAVTPIPTFTEWGMIGLSLLLMGTGYMNIRKRRGLKDIHR
ncbi:MAG TPA: hypothetical protein PLS62_05760 [Desulfobacteraceae bacterium]|nr:hypothetical protein [Desulfobacteraceae bacterium]